MRRPPLSPKAVVCLVVAAVATLVFLHAVRAGQHRKAGAWVPIRPSVAKPVHLSGDYVAPPRAVAARGSAGSLEIPSLGVAAPVAGVELDGQAMAIPNDVWQVGWLKSSARVDDLVGVSLLSGHVSDRVDRAGALARLGELKVGDAVTWRDPSGNALRFRVTTKATYPRSSGLPPEVVAREGRHRLAIVTCTDRVDLGGGRFRYASNLVVVAEAA